MKSEKRRANSRQMAEFFATHQGLTLVAQAKIRGVHPSTVAYWRRKLNPASKPPTKSPSGFVEVPLPSSQSTGTVRIHSGAFQVEVSPGFAPDHLKSVLGVLAKC